VVFIDDNPAERGRIAEAFPEVFVPDWPKDACRFADALRQLDCFDQPSLTAEDHSRVKMYVQERERTVSQRAAARSGGMAHKTAQPSGWPLGR